MEAGLTLGSLFDGIGGFCYAAQLTGRITPIWAAEIEPSCIDITRYRFPEVAAAPKKAKTTRRSRSKKAAAPAEAAAEAPKAEETPAAEEAKAE